MNIEIIRASNAIELGEKLRAHYEKLSEKQRAGEIACVLIHGSSQSSDPYGRIESKTDFIRSWNKLNRGA
jgi:hypothetical protein